jgi:nucleoside-diphosphate-sugar epimerase
MSRVLVTGGAGILGAAVVRRLLADPAYEVRVSDQREVPAWMREGCEVHTGDLRDLTAARTAAAGCTHLIHLAAIVARGTELSKRPHTMIEVNNALHGAVVRAALDHDLERFVYVSSAMVFEHAHEFPTPEEHLRECPAPSGAYGFSKLAGEHFCHAAGEEHGLRFTICRPSTAYGPGEYPDEAPGVSGAGAAIFRRALAGERPIELAGTGEHTRTPTHVADIADGIVTAMRSPAAVNQDFNIAGSEERTVAELAAMVWEICGNDPADFELQTRTEIPVHALRSCPSAAKARELLRWEPRIDLRDGIATTVAWLREQEVVSP